MRFTEEQQFRSKWLWGLIFIVALVTLAPMLRGMYEQAYLGKEIGNNPMGTPALVITFGLVMALLGGLIWLFRSAKLLTSIDEQEIRFRFQPFQTKAKVVAWTEIRSWELTKFKPISQYGGWGVRMTSEGKAYTVQGRDGLKLLLKNGTSIMLGTQKAQELAAFLQKIGK